jgi:hypothetical protein
MTHLPRNPTLAPRTASQAEQDRPEPNWGQKRTRPLPIKPAYLTSEQLAASRAACGVRPLVRK